MNPENKNVFYIIGASILVVLAVIGGLWWYNSSKNSSAPSSVATSLGQTTVTILEPGVFTKMGTDGEKEVTEKEVISQENTSGLTVRTNEKGRALIQSKSGTMTLDHNSEITIDSLEVGKTSATLAFGSVWSQVEKIFEQGEFYEIKTQNAVASVRGTSFGVINDKSTTAILVSKGKVQATPKNQKTAELYTDKGVTVDPGKKAIIKADLSVLLLPISKIDTAGEFYILNNKADDKTDAAMPSETTMVNDKTSVTVTPVSGGQIKVPTQTPKVTAPSSNSGATTAPAPAAFGITGVSPSRVSASADVKVITISGNKFTGAKEVYLGDFALDFDVLSDTTITTAPPNRMTPGAYTVSVVNADGKKTTSTAMVTITQ